MALAPQPTSSLPRRPLGKTGRDVTLFGLGGEGVLRTTGKMAQAVAVIERALELGVNYFDTAPAYEQSRDYYGAALGERRPEIFLASKTHDRTRDGSLRLLEDSLKRLRTDYLDLWQLHDLRSTRDLDQIFSAGGAIEALVEAREARTVRHLGITGHHDPSVLVEAMRRFSFDTVLVALNAADVHRLPFLHTVVPMAVGRGMGVIGMKVCAAGSLVGRGRLTIDQAMGYVLSVAGVSNVIIGCRTPEEVSDNVRAAREFQPLNEAQMRDLERRSRASAAALTYYKKKP